MGSSDARALSRSLLDLCRMRKLTIATAESCTGGLIAERVTRVPGSSEYFGRGVVTYANSAKTALGLALSYSAAGRNRDHGDGYDDLVFPGELRAGSANLEARGALELARRAAERADSLRKEQIASEKEWLLARQEHETAEIRARAVALSLVRTAEARSLGAEVARLAERLGRRVPLAIGSGFLEAPDPREIERGLGRSIDDVFTQFEDEPVASASIAQVHFAVLRAGPHAGKDVAVKVLRPNMLGAIDKDLALLDNVAAVVARKLGRKVDAP